MTLQLSDVADTVFEIFVIELLFDFFCSCKFTDLLHGTENKFSSFLYWILLFFLSLFISGFLSLDSLLQIIFFWLKSPGTLGKESKQVFNLFIFVSHVSSESTSSEFSEVEIIVFLARWCLDFLRLLFSSLVSMSEKCSANLSLSIAFSYVSKKYIKRIKNIFMIKKYIE